MIDTLGDRCKKFENANAQTLMLGRPTFARLDGRAFHTFTRNMHRPYDAAFQLCMRRAVKGLIEDFHPSIGYTQSDEITLLWPGGVLPFDGRVQKMQSVMAGVATAHFLKAALDFLPRHVKERLPVFDCRVWQVPSELDALDVFVWREDDAVRNSVTMAAQAYYSHKELDGKNTSDKHDMLYAKGVNWNNYPAHFKRGVYMRRVQELRTLTEDELMEIPEKHRPNGDKTFVRSAVKTIEMPPIRRVANAVGVVLWGENPEERT